jgi:flagellar basal body-associated protein FliL
MSDRDQTPADRPTGRPTDSGRRRARVLIPLGILLLIVAVFAYILLVSQSGTDDESEIYQQESSSAPVSLRMDLPERSPAHF